MFRTRIAILAAAVASLALMVAPATGLAKAPVRFGARLDPTVQPSNSLPGLPCYAERVLPCTMVQNEAYGRPGGGEVAPRSGTIKRIRLIAGGPGVFRLQVAKVKHSRLYGTSQVKVLADGPKIQYEGQTEANWEATATGSRPSTSTSRSRRASSWRCTSAAPPRRSVAPPAATTR